METNIDKTKLKKAILVAEEYLKDLDEDSKRYKRINKEVEKGYALLNLKDVTQKKLDRETDIIYWVLLDQKPFIIWLRYGLGLLLAGALIFTTYETYTFMDNYWDYVKDIIIKPNPKPDDDNSNSGNKPSQGSNSHPNSHANSHANSNANPNKPSKPNTDNDNTDRIVMVTYKETNIINLYNQIPVDDPVGLKNRPQEFQIYNDMENMPDVDYKVNYIVSLVELNDNKTNVIDSKYIKYKYIKTDSNGNTYESEIGTLDNLIKNPDGTFKFISASQGKGVKDSYKVIFWISSEAGNDQQGREYTLAFRVTAAVQVLN